LSVLDPDQDEPEKLDPRALKIVLVGLIVLFAGGIMAFYATRPSAGPAPEEIADDPLLVEGRELYLRRCVSCHGESGRGNGPIAASLDGPPPGDLTDGRWKHGDQPEQVLEVLREGIQGTGMSGWKFTFNDDQMRAVAAYTYYLAGQPVPEEIRNSEVR
jgi:cytochrome c oxidase cbb3-type subunit 3